MSIDNLKKFMQLVKTDQQVAKKAVAIGYQNILGLIAYGKEIKLDFDEKDFEALHKEAHGQYQELSDNQLEDVAGGFPHQKA